MRTGIIAANIARMRWPVVKVARCKEAGNQCKGYDAFSYFHKI